VLDLNLNVILYGEPQLMYSNDLIFMCLHNLQIIAYFIGKNKHMQREDSCNSQ